MQNKEPSLLLDDVDPQKYVDDLPSMLDKMKAECRAEFDKDTKKGGINSDNRYDWAEMIVVQILNNSVNNFGQPHGVQAHSWGALEARIFPELMKDLVLYAEQRA